MGTAQLLLDGNLYGSSVPVSGATTNIPLLTNTLQSGSHVVSVFYSGDGSHQASTSAPTTLTILDSVGAFTLSPSTTSTNANQGKASTPVTLTATPTGGFNSTITFACAGGLPSGAVCLFTPSSITPTGTSPETTVLTIAPAATTLTSMVPGSHHTSPIMAVTLAGLFVFFLPRRTRRWSVFTLLFALSTLSVLSGCGSGGVVPNPSGPGTLSAGSYAVTVTATGGSTIQTATVTLTIR
jgi:hypothetical protein